MNKKDIISRIIGLALAVLTVFSALACISYLFHWQEDMSLLHGVSAFDRPEVGNAAGLLGFKFGHLLVDRCFGLGSFALLLIFLGVSVKLLFGKWRYTISKTILTAITGAVLTSLFFAFISAVAKLDSLFGHGLGGACGAYVISVCESAMGLAITGLVLLAVILAILFLSRFSKAKPKPEAEAEPAVEPAIKPVAEPVAEPEPLPEPKPAPVPVPESAAVAKAEAKAEPVPGLKIITDEGLNADSVEELTPIDNRTDKMYGLSRYKFPSISLLEDHASSRRVVGESEIQRNNYKIRTVLGNYKIQLRDVTAIVGPTVTLYKVYPAPGVKIADIKKLQEDIAISLGAKGVRVVTLSDAVGIEVANDFSSMVPLKALLNDSAFRESKANLPVAIGYTITQKVKVFDLTDAPHLLIAGATKQGKSVGLNVIVSSLLYSCHPSELKFVFIDPKMVEFPAYNKLLYHYLATLPDENEDDLVANAVVKTPKRAEKILRSLCIEMDERYELLSKAGANNIKLYNEKFKNRKLNPNNGHKFLPYLVAVVDEYADLTMTTGASPEARAASRSITNSIIRLAQKGRAAGLHVILATQRPSVDVISGIIKSNFPMRIAFRVASRVDSQTIIDAPGAEKLIGNGDMLFSAGIDNERIQCGYVSGSEIEAITGFIGEQSGWMKSYNCPYYLPDAADQVGETSTGGVDMADLDDRFIEAATAVVTAQKGSTSDLQRKLGMGYAKAGRVMDQLEAAGIVGHQEGSKPRQVLVADLEQLHEILAKYGK